MAWLAVDKDGQEAIYQEKPVRNDDYWEPFRCCLSDTDYVYVPKGTIAKLIGKDLTWDDASVELR